MSPLPAPAEAFGTHEPDPADADRLSEGDGVRDADPPRRQPFRDRGSGRDRRRARSGEGRTGFGGAGQVPIGAGIGGEACRGQTRWRAGHGDGPRRAAQADRSRQLRNRDDQRPPCCTGSRARAKSAGSASTPKRPRSMPCRPHCAACRWRWRRARPATFLAATARATDSISPRSARRRPDCRKGRARAP